jgi:hypothetical protein
MSKLKTIAFDLDDVICHRTNGYEHLGPNKYDYCIPNQDIIDIVNCLYDEGNTIIIYTARGMSQCKADIDKVYSLLYDKTIDQLTRWNVKYHKLVMGKIHYDILIDDKALNSQQINKKTIDDFLN